MRKQSFILIALLLAIYTCNVVFAQDTTEEQYQSHLRITSPPELAREWNRKLGSVAIGNFGYVPWGRTLVGNLKYANPPDGCTYEWKAGGSGADDEDDDAPILVAERGNCTFTVKALKAQLQGAKMLIVLDNQVENTQGIIPIGDGNEKGVHIPTLLLNKEAGDKLKKAFPKVITAVMYFNFPKRNAIDYEVWLSSTDMKSIEFVKDLETYIPRLGANASFTPYYSSWQSFMPDSDYTRENCISKGAYCAPDPDASGPLKGTDTLEEDLRQLCIWKQGQSYWWSYFKELDAECARTVEMHKCSNKTIKAIGLRPDDIAKCVDESFETFGDRKTDTKLLKPNQDRIYTRNIQFWPSVVINNFTYRGNIEGRDVFDALCEGFSAMPRSCIIDETEVTGKKSSGVVGPMFLLLCVLASFVLIFVLYKRWLKKNLMREMNTQMNVKISQYFSMADPQTR